MTAHPEGIHLDVEAPEPARWTSHASHARMGDAIGDNARAMKVLGRATRVEEPKWIFEPEVKTSMVNGLRVMAMAASTARAFRKFVRPAPIGTARACD